MSMTIASFHKWNKVFKTPQQLEELNKKFKPILNSSHVDQIHNLKDEDIYKANNLLNLLEDVQEAIWAIFRVKVVANSGFRTILINTLIGGKKKSQHPFWEAIDLHFYYKDKRVTEAKYIKMYLVEIDRLFNHRLSQRIRYSWGGHLSLLTARRIVFRLRKGF